MKSTLYTLFKMVRPANIVIAIITLLIGYGLLEHYPPIYVLLLQILGFASALGFANIHNDIIDKKSDKLNRPERPLVTGMVTIKSAKKAWIALAILAILCGLGDTIIQCVKFMNVVKDWEHAAAFGIEGAIILTFPLWFFVLLIALLTAYNRRIKHTPLVKNITVAFLCTTPLLYAVQHYFNFANYESPVNETWAIIPAIPLTFLITTAREIYKDLQDETGDLKVGIKTFPLIAGAKAARVLAGIIIGITWLLLPVPVFFMEEAYNNNYPPLFLIITGITLTPCFIYTLIKAWRHKYHLAQNVLKVAMVIGLLALFISKYAAN
ncbi:UbiA family prenyltransferase [Fibrobacter sp. UWB11]|uniref:UbiA family prenyltransferase n=1 Tax=Fibrobacter sp. UWB11 TaxID=1896202 RepID=UPI00092AC7F3|nr:UbiA family prenyltransferase [Fibrobacter sp. UWB11]SIN97480.1 4-hydroxybenzoate polyprenyltransferase [Fibrobacter sp. UWB11]